eukprot:54200-Prymnesium_polylepis.1
MVPWRGHAERGVCGVGLPDHQSRSHPPPAAHEGLGFALWSGLIWQDPCVKGELDCVLVDDPNGVVDPQGGDDGVKGVLVADGRVELDDLLDLVRSLGELDLGLHITLVCLEQNLDALDLSPEGVRRDPAALHKFGHDVGDGCIGLVEAGIGDGGVEREFHGPRVVDCNCLGVFRRLDDSRDGSEEAVFGVDAELGRDV